MIALGESLQKQKSLKNLELMFEGCGITDIGFGSLSQSIQELEFLEKVHFDFSW